MTSKGGRITAVALAILLLALLVFVAFRDVEVPRQESSAAILALVAAGAVAIERILEVLWTIVGSSKLGNWWPLKPDGDRLNAFVDELNGPLNDFYLQAAPMVGGASRAADNLEPWLDDKQNYLDQLQTHIKNLQQLRPGDPDAQTIAAGASRAVVGLQKHYPDLQNRAAAANRALAGVNRFVQTFEDNPARRLTSLYAGAVLGLLAAGVLGLDAVQAVLGNVSGDLKAKPTTLVQTVYRALPGIGAVATGLAMGLGASPAHEFVKTLKEVKERNRAQARRP